MSQQDGSARRVTLGPSETVDDEATPFLHVDLDAFFVSVELLSRPELRGKPVVVGGSDGRGVVSAASYEARKYGVNSAMSMAAALRRCPNVTVLSGDYAAYSHYSRLFNEILQRHTPLVESVSIDEAFLNVAGVRRVHGSPFTVATNIRNTVQNELGITCSVGVAASKYVAKVASGLAKPDGLLVVPLAETIDFLRPLPLKVLWGVGSVTAEKLSERGLRTVADIAEMEHSVLARMIGEAMAVRLKNLANGFDPRDIETEHVEKSISREQTFERDISDPAQLRTVLLGLADDVCARLRAQGLTARGVALKVRYSDFRTLTRSRTLDEATDVGRRIFDEVFPTMQSLIANGERVRLLGVRAEKLQIGTIQTALWDDFDDWRETELAIDEVSKRFGAGAVRPASMLGVTSRRVLPRSGK